MRTDGQTYGLTNMWKLIDAFCKLGDAFKNSNFSVSNGYTTKMMERVKGGRAWKGIL
jgi:hypothetical protein